MPVAEHNKLELQRGEIHLWITRPANIADSDLIAGYFHLLSEDEAEKQQRFRFEHDRHAALVTRAFVRDLLSAYAPTAARDWRFAAGPNGKPEIIDPPLPLRFNLSHTRGLVTCVVTLADDIGCDVEFVGRRTNLQGIAKSHFSPEEQEQLFQLHDEPAQRSRFFDYWTLKESWIKACGEGIFRVPLADFSFRIGTPATQMINDDISLSFASHIEESPACWKSWLLYHCQEHRIAVSIRQGDVPLPGGNPRYTLRYFESVPLQERKELFW